MVMNQEEVSLWYLIRSHVILTLTQQLGIMSSRKMIFVTFHNIPITRDGESITRFCEFSRPGQVLAIQLKGGTRWDK